jgi:prevent-host-death family protein
MASPEKYTNQNELKIKTKEILGEVSQGARYIVMRYSKPMAVLVSINEYCRLTGADPQKCNLCQKVVTKALAKLTKNK